MKKNDLVAVVNDKLLMTFKGLLNYFVQDEIDDEFDKISAAITDFVTSDARFVATVGKENAGKIRFDILPLYFDEDDGEEKEFILRVIMTVDGEETDFHYDYSLLVCYEDTEIEDAPFVLYNNDGKSRLMQVFESYCHGVTSAKTFKKGSTENYPNDCLESIFEEILSESDLKVF